MNGAWEMFGSMKIDLSGYLTDVTIDGTSVVTDGVAEIPVANNFDFGLVKIGTGIGMSNGKLNLLLPAATDIKSGLGTTNALFPLTQHYSTFYGLAKAAGADEKDSTLAFGTYSDNAKSKIQNMLGITDKYSPKDWMAESETELVTNAHNVGDLFYIGETLYKVIADLNAGDAINVGVNVEEVNVNDILDDYATKEDVQDNVSIVEKSVSGAVASFDDGMDDMPLKSLTVDINPVQDLHGYDSPWIGGGGKNLFEPLSGTRLEITFTPNADGTVSISGTYTSDDAAWVSLSKRVTLPYNGINAGDTVVLYSNVYVGVAAYDSQGTRISSQTGGTSAPTYTIPDNAVELVMYQYAKSSSVEVGEVINITDAKFYIAKENSFSSWTPYENICPISGWTEANVMRDGTNLFDGEMENGDINQYTGENNGTSSSRYRSKNYIPIRAGAYYFKSPNRTGTVRVFFYDKDKTFLYFTAWNVNAVNTFNSEPVRYARFRFSTAKVDGDEQISINSPSRVTDYIPYKGQTIPISWQTEAGTVYGGKLDVLRGILTVYPYYASYNGETLTGRWISDRDVYAVGTTPTIGAQVVNIGAEGTEYQLEPHEVASLLGANNIWADTGDTSIEYFSQVDEDLVDYIKANLNSYAKKDLLNNYVDDVQIDGSSIVTDGVANVPVADENKIGVVATRASFGTAIGLNGAIYIRGSDNNRIKIGTEGYMPIVPQRQHASTFYGLAKAAGADEKDSTLTVGNYTDNAKDKIQTMLGVSPLIAPHESDPFESAHAIGELFIINGKLYRAKTVLAAGEYINEGTNVEVVSVAGVLDSKVGDVQINGTSIVADGVVNVPYAGNNAGVIKTTTNYGTNVNSNGVLYIYESGLNEIKGGTLAYRPITPRHQHESVFYGLTKAAGVDMASSSNAVGIYTDEAKTAIKQMLGVHDTIDSFVEDVTGTDVTITGQPSYRYNCGELYSLTVTPPSSGTIDFRFTSGSTPTVLTLPSTVKMPEWWVEVEANTIYEMCITDGIYCGVISWAI